MKPRLSDICSFASLEGESQASREILYVSVRTEAAVLFDHLNHQYLLWSSNLFNIYRKTSIVIRSLVTPSQALGYGGVYARSYVHGAPIPKFRIQEAASRNVRDVWKLRARRENSLKNYANRYKTWSPYKDKIRLRDPPVNNLVRRRRPIPLGLKYAENEIFHSRRPERPYKRRVNSLQRPTPPAEVQDDFDSDDYFPEETKRAEAQYEYRDSPRRPLKKRRHPSERKKKPKKPLAHPKPYYDDDDRRPFAFEEDFSRHKPKRQPTVSYSTFIQHSPAVPTEVDYDYPDEEDIRLSGRKKKKRIKKKTKKPADEEEDQEEYRSEFSPEVYRPHSAYADDDYEVTTRNKVKLKKYKAEPQPVYGEGHISHQSTSSVYTSNNVHRTPEQYGFQSSQAVQSYNPVAYAQPVTNSPPTHIGYPGYIQHNNIQYNRITQPSRDYSSAGYSGSGFVSGSYTSAPVTSYESLIPSSSTNYQKYRNYQEQQSVYYSPSVSYQKELTTSFRTSPAYDSTDTFKEFNTNASNQKKYATYSSKYSEGSGIIPSVQISERPDQDNDFLQKHQNLYNNGISGVPIQGDGYMNREIKKDYDIGYGEFQFDENPA